MYTYHSPLPDDTHPILDSSHSVRDLCEVLFAQSSLLGAKWTVLRCYNAQSVTGKYSFLHKTIWINVHHWLMRSQHLAFQEQVEYVVCTLSCNKYTLAKQAHEVARRVGVDAQWGDNDMGSSMSPVLVIVLWSVQHCVSDCGLRVDHLTCRELKSTSSLSTSNAFKHATVCLYSSSPCILAAAIMSPADILDTFTMYIGQRAWSHKYSQYCMNSMETPAQRWDININCGVSLPGWRWWRPCESPQTQAVKMIKKTVNQHLCTVKPKWFIPLANSDFKLFFSFF